MKNENSKALQMQEKLNKNIAAHRNTKPTLELYQSYMDDLKKVNEQRITEGLERLTLPNITKNYIELLLRFTFDKDRINRQGNMLYETFFSIGRYYFDDVLCKNGFNQFDTDQDAPYFGQWVSKQHLCTVSYTEGDIYLVVCNDVEQYNKEIQSCIDFYGEGFIAIAIDPEKKESTTYRQDRSIFLIELPEQNKEEK